MTDPRRGMALRELMAIVAVAGVSLGLLARTISRSREEAHRTQCINNAKQLGLGFHSFLSTNNTFPNAGTYGEDPAALASGDPNDSVINHAFDGRFGLIRPGNPEVGPLHNWALCLIPYLGSYPSYYDFNLHFPQLSDGPPSKMPGKRGVLPDHAHFGGVSAGAEKRADPWKSL